MLLVIIWYFFHNIIFGPSLGLGLEVLASFNITVNSITASKGAFTQRTARDGSGTPDGTARYWTIPDGTSGASWLPALPCAV